MAEQLDEKKLAEKKKALENAIASIDKQFGKGAVMKLGDNVGMNVDVISTGALGLDLALGVGGFPGVESSKFTGRNLPERPLSPSMSLQKRKRTEEKRPLSMRSTHSIRFMRRPSASILII